MSALNIIRNRQLLSVDFRTGVGAAAVAGIAFSFALALFLIVLAEAALLLFLAQGAGILMIHDCAFDCKNLLSDGGLFLALAAVNILFSASAIPENRGRETTMIIIRNLRKIHTSKEVVSGTVTSKPFNLFTFYQNEKNENMQRPTAHHHLQKFEQNLLKNINRNSATNKNPTAPPPKQVGFICVRGRSYVTVCRRILDKIHSEEKWI